MARKRSQHPMRRLGSLNGKGINSMNRLLVYGEVGHMDGMHVIDRGWVFARKFKNGKFEKYRARLVARGNHQAA
jgi:hypothetical protein